jgi:hypothetical protein
LSYILDKPDSNNFLTAKIKKLVKAACLDLYHPNKLVNQEIIEIDYNTHQNSDHWLS